MSETEQAVIIQFGGPLGQAVIRAGHAPQGALGPGRLPLRQALARVRRATPTRSRRGTRSTSGSTPTRAGASPIRCCFFQRRRDERGAQCRLDDIIDGETRNAVACFDLIEIVRSSNRAFERTEELEGIMAAEAMARSSSAARRSRASSWRMRRRSRPSSASSWWTCASSASTTSKRSSRRCSSA